jgi:hypothetical protein
MSDVIHRPGIARPADAKNIPAFARLRNRRDWRSACTTAVPCQLSTNTLTYRADE